MRVLHLDSGREWRGGQVQLAHLLGPDDALLAPLDGALAARVTVPRFAYGALGLRAALAAHRPDRIAAHTSHAHGLALLQRSVPVIVHRRVDFAVRWRSRSKYAAVAGFIAVSAAVRDVLVRGGVPDARVRIVHDGIPPAGATGSAPSFPVLAVGALVAHKGHASLIRAASIGGFPVAIAGSGPLAGSLLELADRLGVDLTLLGPRDDVPALLASAGVFVHPSREEGLGQVVLEARALGCPTVATRAGGVLEAVGPQALLVPPDDPEALARAIAVARRLPRPAPELPDRFTVDAMRDATRAAYDALGGRA